MAVSVPTTATQAMAEGESAKRKPSRATRYTPAVTMVAAWMRADTGVGPAMASGSQTWSGSWALLPMAPTKRSTQMRARRAKGPRCCPWSRSATPVDSITTWSRSSRQLRVGPTVMSRCPA